MPSINDIMQVAESLEKSPVIIVGDRCVAVRNRNASCRRCVKTCPADAVSVKVNEATIDASSCIACGACVAACPTEAIVSVKPTGSDVRSAAFGSISKNGGRAVVACARIASKRQADPGRYAEVPCLPHASETLAIQLVAQGAAEVMLVDGNCATCKHGMCASAIDEAVQHANALLAAHGSEARVVRRTGFPEDMRGEGAASMHGSTRRGFFSDAAVAAKETAKAAAKATLESELGYKLDEPSIGERLRVTEAGTLPLLKTPSHEAAINALDVIGIPESGAIESRLFGSVSIDVKKCNACGMCAVFCPTGALSRNPAEKPSDPIRFFEFSASDCVQCGICVDVCWKGALTLSTSVEAAELYDFEPKTFKLPKAKKKRLAF